jgi:hypothetical protein
MRPSPAQLERVAEALVKRLVAAQVVELDAPEAAVRQKFVAILSTNFAQEAEIEAQAQVEAQKLVRQGAPGVRREDLDIRRVEQLMKQKIAKDRGFAL